MIKAIVGTVLNVATGGLWGVAKWVGRRFNRADGRRSFLGGVATFVVGNLVLAVIYGKIDLLAIAKGVGKAAMFLCVFVLNSCGGKGELPREDQEKVGGVIAKVKDAVDDRMDRMEKIKAAMEEQTPEMKEGFERRKKQLEEDSAKKKQEAARWVALKKVKFFDDELEDALKEERDLQKKHGYSFAIGTAEILDRAMKKRAHAQDRARSARAEYRGQIEIALAKVGIVTAYNRYESESVRVCNEYKAKGLTMEAMRLDRMELIKEWNVFMRGESGASQYFLRLDGETTYLEPGVYP